ncbi:MAG: SIS domain-containing protein [Clostridia bacterium]|nr:SIS domain-containing protein [Clostridia bacterium]
MANAAMRYKESLMEMLERAFSSQEEVLERAAQEIAKRLMAGGMIYTFGTGHASLLAQEIFYRAGGPVQVRPILDERLMLHVHASASSDWERRSGIALALLEKYPVKAGDVLILISNSGRNTAPVELALAAKEKGLITVALTNLTHSRAVTPRNPEGKRLFEVCDIVLDNCGVIGDAVVDAGDGRYVSPTSTAVGAALLQAISARVEELARLEGTPLPYFISSNVDGGDEHNEALIAAFREKVAIL